MTNWPDPARPGVPLNPNRSGAHILGSHVLIWRASIGNYMNGNGNVLTPEVACAWPYRGPCLTPDEAAALQKRVAELEEAARIALAMSISSPSVIAAAIRAAAKEVKP